MTITVNGKQETIEGAAHVRDVLNRFFKKEAGIIVELNGEIVHRDRWEEQAVADGDEIELIQFIGGG